MRSLLNLTVLTVGIGACGTSAVIAQDSPHDAGATSADAMTADGREAGPTLRFSTDAPDDATDAEATNCSPSATSYIYVGAGTGEIWRFDPVHLTFTDLGIANCPSVDAEAFGLGAIALDRQGILWVNYATFVGTKEVDLGIYRLDPDSMVCTPTAFNPAGQPPIFDMSFSATSPGSLSETLFLSLYEQGVAYFDSTWTMHPLPVTSDPLYSSYFDLQGTAQGQLFGANVYNNAATPAYLAEIDPSTGAVSMSHSLPGVYSTDGTDFAYWGGKFWFFGNEAPDPTSATVQLYDPATGTLTTVMSDIGFGIDSAAVSVCAPTTMPQ
jgi:hypothetical protein